jgi:hypothetical protein
MIDDLDDRLAARFARQDDPVLSPRAPFELVRSRAAQLERRWQRRRRLTLLAAAVVAALVAVPAIALSRTLIDHFFGQPADAGLRDYIGRVLRVTSGASFATPPRYVAGVRTSRGLVLLWAARRDDGSQCSGLEAAFGDADIVRLELARRTIADNGFGCSGGQKPLGLHNAGLTTGQGLGGGLHVYYGQVPQRVQAVRITFEDGRTRTLTAGHGWVITAFERGTSRPGHRPILEQALDARAHPLASVRLDPWDYGGTPPPPPKLDGPGSTLVTTVATPSGPAQFRLSAPGRGWQREQCGGLMLGRRSLRLACTYPAALDPSTPPPLTNNLFVNGPRFPGLVIATATRIDQAWLVGADHGVRPGRIVRFSLAGLPHVVVVATELRGARALAGIVTSRDHRAVGALLVARPGRLPPNAAIAPCFLAAPSAGAPAATPACRALMATARRAVASATP